jgi:hypothetical protein
MLSGQRGVDVVPVFRHFDPRGLALATPMAEHLRDVVHRRCNLAGAKSQVMFPTFELAGGRPRKSRHDIGRQRDWTTDAVGMKKVVGREVRLQARPAMDTGRIDEVLIRVYDIMVFERSRQLGDGVGCPEVSRVDERDVVSLARVERALKES